MAREFSKHIYKGKAWIKTREYIFRKYDGICQKCGAPGEEVHHKIFLRPSNIDDPDIVYGEDNLILLCKDCHFREHEKTNSKFKVKRERAVENGLYFNEDGELVSQEVMIVYGAPASGKSTYVSRHMKEGDLVVDLDLLKQAISLAVKTETTDNLLETAIELRDKLYELIEEKKVDAERIWVIASLPRREERTNLAKRLNAKLIHCDATVRECLDRANADTTRLDKQKQIDIIDKYFANYEK
ncbi:MAG: HNH endonuclease [Prevotellaceae bacterium]|nr:MAG: HNH endonuclease [Prevotellaceae bacterium]